MRLMAFSLLIACSCAIQRPDTDLCIVNAPAEHLKCYNMLRDYDDRGNLKSGAQATFRPAHSVRDINKYLATDPKGLANLKTYIGQLRDEYENRCQ